MTVSTHVSTALAWSSVAILIYSKTYGDISLDFITGFYTTLIFGVVFPDIDEPESWIGRRTIIISNIIKFIFGHRGFTHTLIFTILLLIIGLIYIDIYIGLNSKMIYMLYGFVAGVFLHIIGDAHTKGGVPLLLPFSKKKFFILPKFMRFKTNSFTEYIYNFIYLGIFSLVLYISANEHNVELFLQKIN